jgi:hypothetical protein
MSSDQMANGEAYTGLHVNVERKARRGYAVDTGGTVSINSGNLDAADTLTVKATDYWFGGQPVSAAAQSVGIDGGDGDPRKDVVFLDGNGDAQVAKGTPAPVSTDQQGVTRFATYRPTAPDLEATDAVILAEVWVPAGADAIAANDVEQRTAYENRQSVLASQSITLTGGGDPAADVTLDGVVDDQFQDMAVIVTTDTDPGFAADYGYNYDWTRTWDDTNQQIDVDVGVSWDPDPGAGNDVSATVYAVHKDL